MSDDKQIRVDTRLAGQVTRYHTWPRIHQQSIAEHSWQLARIYASVVDKIDPNFILHILFHDIGEFYVGDIPYPVKRDIPELKELIDELENDSQEFQLAHWNTIHPDALEQHDSVLFKHIELVEMAEWGMDEFNFGNHHGFVVANRCLRALYEQAPCNQLINYVIKRLALFYSQNQLNTDACNWDWWYVRRWRERLNDPERHTADSNRAQEDTR